ncbi:MAG: hypothetical protein RLZZ15_1513 [Verrucomicrobiota bacterium]
MNSSPALSSSPAAPRATRPLALPRGPLTSLTSLARRSPLARRARRGSILIVAMIFASVIAIALTSYIKLASTALNLSQRSFLANDTMNLTEAGLEQGLWSFNQAIAGDANAWAGWTISGNNATRTFTGFALSQNATGTAKVYVQNYNSSGTPAPLIVAQGVVTPAGGGGAINKLVEVRLIRRSLFANGMVGRNGITFSGTNASVDSWNSDPDNNSATAAIAYSGGVRHDLGSIAAVNVTANISVQNADIWGFASVGGPSTTAIQVGSQGVVGPFGTAAGTKDPSRVASNFTDNLPDAVNPTIPAGYTTPTIASISGAYTLPRGTDSAASDGVYYYNIGSISETGAATNILQITAGRKVVIIVTSPVGTTGINVAGNGGINLGAGSTLAIYTASDIKIAGNGLLNPNTQPISCQIWGTATSAGSQAIEIAGNGALSSVTYAPEANVKINGNGDVLGSVVGYTVTVVGNASFHYDESLANWGGSNPFQISKWRELVSATDRATYASALGF